MESNKIEGVKPFNEFLFRNCYWHQLIAGLSCLGIDGDNVLINSMVFAKEDFEVDESGILPTKEFEKFFGYRCRRCGVTERSLVKNIDRGRPVIVGIDCFFLESREDTYRKLHDPHFVLVYGYDREKRLAFVIDHKYRNGFNFSEKVVSLDNILLANRMYKKYIRRTHFTSRVLYLSEQGRQNGDLLEKIDKERLTEGKKYSENNLKELHRLLTEDINVLRENSERIIRYLRIMTTSLKCLSKSAFFGGNKSRLFLVDKLIIGYSNLSSLLVKMSAQNNFEYALKWRENIVRKINEVEEFEKKVYDLLMGESDEDI